MKKSSTQEIKQTMTFNQFVEGDQLEETVVSNCPTYRKKFLKIIKKGGVEDNYITDKKALKKIRGTISWNWAAFFFSSFWAIYRKDKTFGWGTLSMVIFIDLLALSFPTLERATLTIPFALAVMIGLLGNSYVLHNSVKNYAETTSEVDRDQRSLLQLFVAIAVVIIFGFYFISVE